MMSEDNKEIDPKKTDTTTDANGENKKSDDGNEEEFDYNDDEQDEESDDEDDESSEDDDKPVTQKQLRDLLKSNQNSRNADRRVSSKKRPISKPSNQTDERLNSFESFQKNQELLERKRQFGHENNLSPKAVDMIFRVTKRPTKAILNDPFIKGGLEKLSQSDNVRGNTPGSSPSATKFAGKDWSELKPEEKQANFTERRQAILEGKRKR